MRTSKCRIVRTRAVLLVASLILAGTAGRARAQEAPEPHVVVALVDTGINPYHETFRDTSALAYVHPSTYLPGYPADAERLDLSLDAPSFEEALRRDEEKLAKIQRGKLYWIPGTRIVGAIRFSSGTASCPGPLQTPPVPLNNACTEHNLIDDAGHGTMTASRAAGGPVGASGVHSLAPEARIVAIEGLGAPGVRWASSQSWIDVQSHSWLTLVPPPAEQDVSPAFADAARRQAVFVASGNGAAYTNGLAPMSTYTLATAAPGVVLVGAHDNGKVSQWSGSPPHVVADGYGGWTAANRDRTTYGPHPIACCTSAAAPYAAGGAAAIVLEARRILHDTSVGVRDGVVASGPRQPSGILDDGVFTLDELRSLVLHTAEARPVEGRDDGLAHWLGAGGNPSVLPYGPGANPFCQGCWTAPVAWTSVPDPVPAYPLVGYGQISERSVDAAARVLRGETGVPARPADDALYAADQTLRSVLFS